MDKLSKSQTLVYEYIKSHQEEKGYPPSVREICTAIGLKSTSTVHGHIERLQKKGLLKRDPTKPRAIEIVEFQSNRAKLVKTPVVGRVTAGAPILAVEDIEDYLSLPSAFVKSEDAFILNVKGDSMEDAGILNGDRIVIQPDASVYNGDIVVALIADENSNEHSATVKRFFREGDQVRLQPENPAYEPIWVSCKDVSIVGKVVGLMRSY